MNYLVVRFVYDNRKIETLVEGTEDVLIDHGQIQPAMLKRELISQSELEIAAHKEGFCSLDEIEKAVLEPDGGISFIAKKPEPGTERHQELVSRLDEMTREIAPLRTELAARK